MSATRSPIPRPSPDVLRGLYLTHGFGCPEIGQWFGRDPKTVLWWLRQAGIPTRPRGSDPRQHFQRGQQGAFAGRCHSAASRAKIKAATIARGGVPYLRNGRHWMADQPPSANGRWLGGITPERQTFYRSPEWKAAVRLVWQRANACCERCGRDFRAVNRRREQAFHVHHVVSFVVVALRAVLANLALLCRDCHLFVHSAANVECEFLGSPYGAGVVKDRAA